MASDYSIIRRDNERRYGTDIGRIGPMLLADRYDDRTHFIYELLQNAEDAVAKRGAWNGKRSVHFHLNHKELRVSHFGKPFDDADVRGVCGIAESTKDLTAIGRFGIGFKSVYAFTDQPEVYSGNESFAIESFVWPFSVPSISREMDETVVVLPLRDPSERSEIEVGLQRLGPASLLFLRAIDEIVWSVEGGASGQYLRGEPRQLGPRVRRVMLIGQSTGSADVEESWLLFSKPILTPQEKQAGFVEVAFSLGDDREAGEELRPVARSPLIVFFPTVLETHLGFLVQGPYRTTPSRDNVPAQDVWNRHCVAESAAVLRDALLWLRDRRSLGIQALRCLPLDRSKFPDGAMFAPIFDVVKSALSEEALLPRYGGGYTRARPARLARTQELRELFSSKQLSVVLGNETELAWLDSEISPDRTPELRDYLIKELGIEELRPETILPKLTAAFLEAQPDDWIQRLYEFLGDQKALLSRSKELPLIRLADGTHVRAQVNGQPQAYLPGSVTTDFPTVRSAVCSSKEARAFLQTLDLAEPDLVDDVISNVLPRYSSAAITAPDRVYATDIERMLRAYATDSESRRSTLVAALRVAHFVAAREQFDNSAHMARPVDVYLATERLVELFAGVKNVLIVDNAHECLRGEDVRTMLVACGGRRSLDPVPVEAHLTWEQRATIRRNAGLERDSWAKPIADVTLRGLKELLDLMPRLECSAQRRRAMLLWDALSDLESRQGSGAFLGTYAWGYFHESRTARFDAEFVDVLNERDWIPEADGNLKGPSAVLFDSLAWNANPFLLSKIRFKPPLIEQLAREVGIDLGVLDLLKQLGVTSEAQLRQRLGVSNDDPAAGNVDDALKSLGITEAPTPAVPDPTLNDPVTPVGHSSTSTRGSGESRGQYATDHTRGLPFVSYIATGPEDEGPDPDGLDHQSRLALEDKAIDFILLREPTWRRTPPQNPGFDLFEAGSDGRATRWCEVKAMAKSFRDRPATLSHTQFEFAQVKGNSYWLYAVEHAGTAHARIVRIQNPAGKARTFTYDRGWLDVAQIDADTDNTEG